MIPGPALLSRLLAGVLAAALVSVPAVLLLLLVQSRWPPLARLDTGLALALNEVARDRPGLVTALEVVEVALAPRTFQVVVGVAVLVLAVRGARRVAMWAAATAWGAGLLGVGLKLLVERARPALDAPVAHSSGYSFPSGHALNSFVGSAVLLLVVLPVLRGGQRYAAAALAATLTLLTGYDRVALGVHYVSDVLAGWLVGLAVLAGTTVGFETWRRHVGLPPREPLAGLEDEEARELSGQQVEDTR